MAAFTQEHQYMTTYADTPVATVAPRGWAVPVARTYHLVIALIGTATLVVYAWTAATYEQNYGAFNGVVFTYSFFTIWSNLFTAIVTWSLVVRPDNDGRIFRWLRMTSLVMITITGLIYFLVLAATANPQGVYVYTNIAAHYIVPWGTVLGFLLFGPRPRFSVRHVFEMLIIPVIWLTYTLVHGAFLTTPPANTFPEGTEGFVPGQPMHFYPYPFIDATDPSPLIPGLAGPGYQGVAINIGVIVLLGLTMGFIFLGVDRLLSGGRRPPPLDGPPAATPDAASSPTDAQPGLPNQRSAPAPTDQPAPES